MFYFISYSLVCGMMLYKNVFLPNVHFMYITSTFLNNQMNITHERVTDILIQLALNIPNVFVNTENNNM